MEIILLRHGKPETPSLNSMSASAFSSWVRDYNASGLSKHSKPTDDALARISECNAVVCSSLPRSIDSARALSAENVVLSDSVFNEAGLPFAHWHRLKLPPTVWTVFFRVLWLFGYSRNSESLEEAKTRAVEAAKLLVDLTDEHGKVAFVGHGVFNRLLANELRKTGWEGPKNPGSKHWEFGVYQSRDA